MKGVLVRGVGLHRNVAAHTYGAQEVGRDEPARFMRWHQIAVAGQVVARRIR